MKARRGFTMLEVLLASVLGVMLIGVCLSMFVLLNQAQARVERSTDRQVELATLHNALQSSFRQLVLNARARAVRPGQNAPAQPQGQPNGQPVNPDNKAAAAALGDPAATTFATTSATSSAIDPDHAAAEASKGPARLLLVKDPTSGLQSLEVVLARAPIALKLKDGSAALANPEAGGGTRGRFELRPEPATNGWAVWYTAFAATDGPDGPRSGMGERRLAGGLKKFNWTFQKTGKKPDGKSTGLLEKLTELRAVDTSEIPAYVEVDVETVEGQKANWMFELGFTIGREQESMPALDPDLTQRLLGRRKADTVGGSGTRNPKPAKPTDGPARSEQPDRR